MKRHTLPAVILAALSVAGAPASAIDDYVHPTIPDNTGAWRMTIAGAEYAAVPNGDLRQTGSIDFIKPGVVSLTTGRVSLPDGMNARRCLPVEDSDLVATIDASGTSVTLWRVQPAGTSFTITAVRTQACESQVNGISAVSPDGTQMVIQHTAGNRLYRAGQASVALPPAYPVKWVSTGFALVLSPPAISNVSGSARIALPTGAAYGFSRDAVYVTDGVAALEKRVLPDFAVSARYTLNGFASILKVVVSATGHALVIGLDDKQGHRSQLCKSDGTTLPAISCSPQAWAVQCLSADGQFGLGSISSNRFIWSVAEGTPVSPVLASGSQIGSCFLNDADGNPWAIHPEFWGDYVVISRANAPRHMSSGNGQLLASRPVMATDGATLTAVVTPYQPFATELPVEGRLLQPAGQTGLVIRSASRSSWVPRGGSASFEVEALQDGAHIGLFAFEDATRKAEPPAVVPIVIKRGAGGGFTPAQVAKFQLWRAAIKRGLRDPRLVNLIIHLPTTAFGLEPGSKVTHWSNSAEWAVHIQHNAREAAFEGHPEYWADVDKALSSILLLMTNPVLYDETNGVFRSHFFYIKSPTGVDLTASQVTGDGTLPSSDDHGLMYHALAMVKGMAEARGQYGIVDKTARILRKINLRRFVRDDGRIAQNRSNAGVFGSSDFNRWVAEGREYFCAMAISGQFTREELVRTAKTLQAKTILWQGTTGIASANTDAALFFGPLHALMGLPLTPDESAGAMGFLSTLSVTEANRDWSRRYGIDFPSSPAMDVPTLAGGGKPAQIEGPGNEWRLPTNPAGHATATVAAAAALCRPAYLPDSLRDYCMESLAKYEADYFDSIVGWTSAVPLFAQAPFPGLEGKRIGLLNSLFFEAALTDALNPTAPMSRMHPARELLAAITRAMDGPGPDALPSELPAMALPAVITSQPVAVSVNAGSAVSFSVTAEGADMHYMWLKDGLAIAAADAPTLNLASVTAADAGDYSVRIVTPGGTVESLSARLSVRALPMIVTQPQSTMLAAGQGLSLSVQATGEGPLSYAWLRDGLVVQGATSSTLSVAAVSTIHAGTYSVRVTNGVGSVTSVDASVVVCAFGPMPAATVQAGQPVSFAVSVAGGGGVVTCRWTRDGQLLPFTATSFTIPSAALSDAGDYVCEVTTAWGTLAGFVRRVSIETVPVVANPGPQSWMVGRNVSLALTATATPPVTGWTMTGQPRGVIFNTTTGVLSGRPATPGNYVLRVTARNQNRTSAVVSIPVSVKPLPLIFSGTFTGICERDETINRRLGARLDFTVASSAAVSGKLTVASSVYAFTGAIEVLDTTFARLDVSIPRAGSTPLSLSLLLGDDGSGEGLLASAGFTAKVIVGRKSDDVATTGIFNVVILNDSPETAGQMDVPNGVSMATVTIGSTGTATLAGTMADGSPFTSSTVVTTEGRILLCTTAGTNGSVLAEMDLRELAEGPVTAEITGIASWTKLAQASTVRAYRAGFDLPSLSVEGGRYIAPPAGAVVMGLRNVGNNVVLSWRDGGIPSSVVDITGSIRCAAGSKIQVVTLPAIGSVLNPQRATLAITPSNGIFTVTFVVPNPVASLARSVSCRGQIYWSPTQGMFAADGFYLLPQLPQPGQTLLTSPQLSGRIGLRQTTP